MRGDGVARRVLGMIVLGGLCVGLSGCILIGASTEKKGPPPTVGQQLIDLKAAHEKGAMTDQEYAQAKQKVLAECERD